MKILFLSVLILMFFLAGCETTSNSFAFITYGKINTPTQKAREEEKKQTLENEKKIKVREIGQQENEQQ